MKTEKELRDLSFENETIIDTKMSKIYEVLDKYNVPFDEQLKIHNEITEMLNVIEKYNGSKI